MEDCELFLCRLYKPKYVEFASEHRRVDSFRSCPMVHIDPHRFSRAGFFLMRHRCPCDLTACFSCGLKIHMWEPGDDPWEEHAKFEPHCAHLVLGKGWKFIHDVRREMILLSTNSTGIERQPGYPKCVICLTNDMGAIYFPCGHACTCRQCGASVSDCPMCKNKILYIARMFHP